MKPIRLIVIAVCLIGLRIVSFAFATFNAENKIKNLNVKGDEKGFAVVELFTSEGCSSCPPADELVARIQNENAGKPIYILAYHVDYWDRLGWKDTFSNVDYSKRQNQYANWFHLQSVYTPQIVMNGKTEFIGSNQDALVKAISAGLQKTPAGSLTLKNIVANHQIRVDYQTNGPIKKSDLVIALIQKSGQTKVKAGENAGRVLSHIQIVRKLIITSLDNSSGVINLAFPTDDKGNEWELVGLVQNKLNGEIFSAARSELTPPNN